MAKKKKVTKKKKKTVKKRVRKMPVPDVLDRLRVESKIRVLSFKHRGDVGSIVEEIRKEFPDHGCALTVVYVKRVIKKFKTEETTNTPFVAAWTFEYLMQGIRQRQIEWEEEFALYNEHRFKRMSFCCNSIAVEHTFDGLAGWLCTRCTEACQVRNELNLEIMRSIRNARMEKRKDDADLAKAVEALGFGKSAGTTQNTVVLPEATVRKENTTKRVESTEVPKAIQGAVAGVKTMSPMDQTLVLGQIQQTLDDVTSGRTLVEDDEDGEEHGEQETQNTETEVDNEA